jgi:glycosyltransferase involved in cell wall biosynthesis
VFVRWIALHAHDAQNTLTRLCVWLLSAEVQITFVSPTVNMSGGTKVIAVHAEGLARMGHAVRVVSPPPPPIPLRRKMRSFVLGEGWPRATHAPSSHLHGRAIDHRILDRWRPITDADVPAGDVVVATWWETAEWVNALGPSKGAKVYFIQGHEIFPNLPIERCHATYRLPMHKIVVSRWLKEIMATHYADDTVDVVLNSVDQRQFFAPVRGKQSAHTVGLVYATGAIKGVDASLAAIEGVRKRFPELRVACFGAERASTQLPLPAGCEFTFAPPQDEIRRVYAKCDVWISASRSDGFNLPVIEAMACRTPVVTTRTGWPAEALRTGRNGVLVDIDDHEGLRKGLEWVLSLDDEEWRRLSSRAYATATSSSWQESTATFEEALRHACERSGRGEIAGRCMSPR